MSSYYPEGADKARQFAVAAFELMGSREISSTPPNYTVWYNYFANHLPELTRGLELMLRGNIDFTDERNEEIYEKYFGGGHDGQLLLETCGRIESAVGLVLEQVDESGRNTSEFDGKLTSFTGHLDERRDSGDIRDMVEAIRHEARLLLEKNRDMAESLNESAREIGDLYQHLEKVRLETMTDSVTGLANRKSFDNMLREEATAHQESGAELCLLLADIDHFKAFNDTYGHRIGDEVLRVVGGALKSGLKGRDTAARYGGEEFAVILPATRLKDATTVAEQLRAALASRQLKNRKTGQTYGTVTISVGVAKYRDGEPLGELIQRADEALYRAKHEGRNRVVSELELAERASRAG